MTLEEIIKIQDNKLEGVLLTIKEDGVYYLTEKLITTKLNGRYFNNTDLLIELDKDYYEIGNIDLDNMRIKYIKTKHLAHEKVGVDHYVYILEIDKRVAG